jgi:hypothetical protein
VDAAKSLPLHNVQKLDICIDIVEKKGANQFFTHDYEGSPPP